MWVNIYAFMRKDDEITFATVNPDTRELLKTFLTAADAQVQQAIDKAQNAFIFWRETPFGVGAGPRRTP